MHSTLDTSVGVDVRMRSSTLPRLYSRFRHNLNKVVVVKYLHKTVIHTLSRTVRFDRRLTVKPCEPCVVLVQVDKAGNNAIVV